MEKMKKFLEKLTQAMLAVSNVRLYQFICGLLLTQFITGVIFAISHISYGGLIAGFCITLIITICKEMYDKKYSEQNFSIKDIAFALSGALIGSAFLILAVI